MSQMLETSQVRRAAAYTRSDRGSHHSSHEGPGGTMGAERSSEDRSNEGLELSAAILRSAAAASAADEAAPPPVSPRPKSDTAVSIQQKIGEHADKQTVKCCCCTLRRSLFTLLSSVASLCILVLVGGALFQAVEEPNALALALAHEKAHEAAAVRMLELLGGNKTLFALIKTNDPFESFAEPPTYDENWTFFSSCMFGFTLVTTIGYGSFAPATDGGKALLVVFSLFGIPLAGTTLVLLSTNALKVVTWFFSLGSDKVEQAFKNLDTDGSGALDLEEFREAIESLEGLELTDLQFQELVVLVDTDGSGEIELDEFIVAVGMLHADISEAAGRSNRIKIILLTIFLWMLLGTVVFFSDEGIGGWGNAFYFSFVTLTTIGLGDEFPVRVGTQLFLYVFASIGLGLIVTLISLVEMFLNDLEKARKAALAKAHKMAVEKAEQAKHKMAAVGRSTGLMAKLKRKASKAKATVQERKKSSTSGMSGSKEVDVVVDAHGDEFSTAKSPWGLSSAKARADSKLAAES